MDAPPPWPVVSSKQVLETRVYRVFEDVASSPLDGRDHVFSRIEADDWVNVVPITAAGEIVFVRQYRHGARRNTLEIPGGIVDPGETPAQAGLRELREETGYGGGTLSYLGVVNPNPALFGNRTFTYLVAGVEPVAEKRNEGTEDTRVVLVPQARLDEHVANGEIDHALVIAALFWFERAGRGLANPPEPPPSGT